MTPREHLAFIIHCKANRGQVESTFADLSWPEIVALVQTPGHRRSDICDALEKADMILTSYPGIEALEEALKDVPSLDDELTHNQRLAVVIVLDEVRGVRQAVYNQMKGEPRLQGLAEFTEDVYRRLALHVDAKPQPVHDSDRYIDEQIAKGNPVFCEAYPDRVKAVAANKGNRT